MNRVTVVIVPRERFSLAEPSLESVLDGTRLPHDLVYVDGGSPPGVAAYLEARAASAGFRRIRLAEPLSQNAARNRALPFVRSEYVAFLDNDVFVEPGWLEALVRCADETAAGVVGALVTMGEGPESVIHFAGGELIHESGAPGLLAERHREMNEPTATTRPRLRRGPCDFAEFHALLVRRSVLDEIGPFDESLLSTPEHIDFCLLAKQAGHETWFEPDAVVRYVVPEALLLADALFFRTRWGEAWGRRSLAHFTKKWQLDPGSPFLASNRAFMNEHLARCPLPDPEQASRRSAEFDVHDHGYAQTPAQLYHQLRRAGCDDSDLERIGRACEHAVALFSGVFRACRKPLLCHGVGTASILAAHGAPLPLVIAGLMHAAYTHGRFEGAHSGVTQPRRDHMESWFGLRVEALIRRCAESAGKPLEADADLDTLDGLDAAVCLVRIASELEERLDLALGFTSKPNDLPTLQRRFYRALADRVGIPALVDQLDAAIRAGEHHDIPDAMQHPEGSSFAIAERSRRAEPFWQPPKPKRRRSRNRWSPFRRRRRPTPS